MWRHLSSNPVMVFNLTILIFYQLSCNIVFPFLPFLCFCLMQGKWLHLFFIRKKKKRSGYGVLIAAISR
ncbi:hypothetical protein MtrunA17_Chr4g0064181 [Medicago truncatula]|uniref:Transmembrane protein n=1 Tax=Medicago truncatula TaxID=3880 RepID=A0A396IEH3_MEDTR|nr:hypothetical protein MtrunA17_Chr4g0064181 [Medicago truncatula]